MTAAQEIISIAVIGPSGHGKSALIGRLLHDGGGLPEGKLEAVQAMPEFQGRPFEWAFLAHALQAGPDQGAPTDVPGRQIPLRTAKRGYGILDVPAGEGGLRRAIASAAASDAVLFLIDAAEGITDQSRRYGYLLGLLGARQIVVAVTKMDLVGYSRAHFETIERDFRAHLRDFDLTSAQFVPVSVRDGDNIARASQAMEGYRGPTVLQALDNLQGLSRLNDLPLRFPVRDVDGVGEQRSIKGRIESGSLGVGDNLLFSPSNRVGRVRSIVIEPTSAQTDRAAAGDRVAVALEEQFSVRPGDVASHQDHPPIESDVFRARLYWLGEGQLTAGSRLTVQLNGAAVPLTVQSIERIIDPVRLSDKDAAAVTGNQVAEIILRADRLLALDAFTDLPQTGRFIAVEEGEIAGAGILSMEGYADQRHLITRQSSNIQRVEHDVTAQDRARRNGHRGGILWFTGLSGAGKSTVAVAVERRLFNLGYQTYVLDGDNVRHGLNRDLGFLPEDRSENIRRIGEVAALISRAGMLCITAFISPYRSDRARAREAGGDQFAEIFIKADLAVCERRDPKGLYKKARAGEIPDFTGISAPYEEPENPDLVVDTSRLSVDETVQQVVEYVQGRFAIDAGQARD